MGFYEDDVKNKDLRSVGQIKDQFDNIITDAGKEIDNIVTPRYGPLGKYSTHINLLKSKLEALKVKYNLPAVDTELDGFIADVDSQIAAVIARWDTEVYDKLNG